VVENVKTGEIIHDDADVLVSARGNLNDKAWPKIPGFETFKGEVMHSAQWNEESVHLSWARQQLIVADMTLRISRWVLLEGDPAPSRLSQNFRRLRE
jgi:hypothetical protein